LNSTFVRAPFDGILGRLHEQLGSFVKAGDTLTTLSDNSVMRAYFKVPEKQYLEFMASRNQPEGVKIELVLANQTKLPQPGMFDAIEAGFDNQTGTIAFRADFPNPDRRLRHGQTGTILMHRKVHDAIVIPQRATYESMNKRYVYVVDKDDVAHRREIVVQNEMDDIFVIKKGVGVDDRIVLEGIRQVRDGAKVEYEFRPPEEAMRKPRNHAE
jgi:membrane fusion protein (multidrug efflux system)